jgi:hypothetical protein
VLRHAFVTTMLDAGGALRDVQIGAPRAGPPNHRPLRLRASLASHGGIAISGRLASRRFT